MKRKDKEKTLKYSDSTTKNPRMISKKPLINSKFVQKRTSSDPNCCNLRPTLENGNFRMFMNHKTMTYKTFYCKISRRSRANKILENVAEERTEISRLAKHQELSIGDTYLTKKEKAPICIKMPSVAINEDNAKEGQKIKSSNLVSSETNRRLDNFDEQEEENDLKTVTMDFVQKAFHKIHNYLLSLLEQQKNLTDTLAEKDQKLKEMKDHLRKVLKKNVTLRSELKTENKFSEDIRSELHWKETELQKYEGLLLELQGLFSNYAQANKTLLSDWQETQNVIKDQKQEVTVKEAEIRELKEKVQNLMNEVQKQREVSAETSSDLIETNDILIEHKNLIESLNAQLENAKKSERKTRAKMKQKEDEINSISRKLSEANVTIDAFYSELARISNELNQQKKKDARVERVMKLMQSHREKNQEQLYEANETSKLNISGKEEVSKLVNEVHRKEEDIANYYRLYSNENLERKNLRKIFGCFVFEQKNKDGSDLLTFSDEFCDWEGNNKNAEKISV